MYVMRWSSKSLYEVSVGLKNNDFILALLEWEIY